MKWRLWSQVKNELEKKKKRKIDMQQRQQIMFHHIQICENELVGMMNSMTRYDADKKWK